MPRAQDRLFRVLVFDWDGTAVASRTQDPAELRRAIERLLRQNVIIVAVTGTHKGHLERQLADGIRGTHKRNLFLATNRGSEVFWFDEAGRATPIWRRVATPAEDRGLTAATEALRDDLRHRTGLDFRIVSDRLNRRKLDLIPLPEWADPPKSSLGALLEAVERRLLGAGLAGGLKESVEVAWRHASEQGLADPRITCDVKHIEIGLTDKGDSVRWVLEQMVRRRGVEPCELLVAADEFGPVAGLPGSDSLMRVPGTEEAVFVSVGPEPGGVPDGVVHLGGGPGRFRDLLAALAGRLTLPVGPPADPDWLLVEEGFNIAREHEVESLLALGNGYVGTRASLGEGSALSEPATYFAGVFETGDRADSVPRLMWSPDWLGIRVSVDGADLRPDKARPATHRRTLDMGDAMLWREWSHEDPSGRVSLIRAFRLVSQDDRHVLVESLSFRPDNFSGEVSIEALLEGGQLRQAGAFDVATRAAPDGTTIAFASFGWLRGPGGEAIGHDRVGDVAGMIRWRFQAAMDATYRLERIVVGYSSRDVPDPEDAACRHLERVIEKGTADLVAAHRRAWQARWRSSQVQIAGDAAAQHALRFAGYHLMSAVNPDDPDVSVGARGLTGRAYLGHYFWDTEVHLLPYYTLTWPAAAMALLRWRHRTLPAARRKARELGFQGALYAWEAIGNGDEVTPPLVVAPDGLVVPIETRDHAHHISAAVAHATWGFWRATADDRFMAEIGADIVFETARFWASRCQAGADGLWHICHVVGPDEYHPDVDDDAYTNVMAQWNLEAAGKLAGYLADRLPDAWRDVGQRLALGPREVASWRNRSARLYTGLDPETGLIEQFRGYFALPDVSLPPFEERSAPPDILLGRETVRNSRLIKQADVLLLFLILPERFSRAIQDINYRFYAPRCGHGSSLSPGVHAAVAARLGHTDEALRFFRQTADVDLADNMGNAAGGVHMAALGSLWQALAFGFAGLRCDGADLRFEPDLPAAWTELRLRLAWRGRVVEATLRLDGTWGIEEVRE